MRQRLGLTVSGAAASSLMKPVNLERSQTILPFSSLMTPSSGNRAIRPRLAFAKSALSDHGSEAVEFLLNSRVDGDAGSPAVEAVCAATLRGAASNPTAAVAAVKQITSRRFTFELDMTTSVSRIAACSCVPVRSSIERMENPPCNLLYSIPLLDLSSSVVGLEKFRPLTHLLPPQSCPSHVRRWRQLSSTRFA